MIVVFVINSQSLEDTQFRYISQKYTLENYTLEKYTFGSKEIAYAVFPTRPSLDGRARLDGRLGKIARLTPVFLWFCPSICDFGHVHERYWAVWQTGQQRFQRALNHKKTTKSLKPEFCPSLRPSNARIFVQKAPVFLQKWACLKNWEHCKWP